MHEVDVLVEDEIDPGNLFTDDEWLFTEKFDDMRHLFKNMFVQIGSFAFWVIAAFDELVVGLGEYAGNHGNLGLGCGFWQQA